MSPVYLIQTFRFLFSEAANLKRQLNVISTAKCKDANLKESLRKTGIAVGIYIVFNYMKNFIMYLHDNIYCLIYFNIKIFYLYFIRICALFGSFYLNM